MYRIDNLKSFLVVALSILSMYWASSFGEVAAATDEGLALSPVDITGIYQSEMSYNQQVRGVSRDVFGPIPNITFTIKQDRDSISGTFTGTRSGELEGFRNGNVISIDWYITGGGIATSGTGKLLVSEDGYILSGNFELKQYSGSGNWTLKKIGYQESPRTPEITNKTDNNEMVHAASGTGFAVSPNGHVVTNNHVIDGCTYVKIHHGGKAIRSTILYRDPINDLAVLRGKFVPTNIFKISRKNPEIMQEVFVAGFPFGNHVSSSVKVTKGIVSSLTGIGNNVSNIQIDAALQPGNSGGPIFDNKGNVIGVAVAKLDFQKVVKDWGVIPENTNFGIKSNVVVNLLENNGIKFHEASNKSLSNAELGKMMRGATYHLSCWMTMAQVRKMATSKVLFPDLTN